MMKDNKIKTIITGKGLYFMIDRRIIGARKTKIAVGIKIDEILYGVLSVSNPIHHSISLSVVTSLLTINLLTNINIFERNMKRLDEVQHNRGLNRGNKELL